MKKETEEKAAELLKSLENHPLMEKIKAEKETENLAKRTTAKNKINDLQKEAETLLPPFQEKIEEFKKDLRTLDETRICLQTELSKAVVELQRKKLDLENEIKQNEEILLSSYPPEIDSAISFFRDKFDELRKPGKIDHRKLGSVRNIITWTKKIRTESNERALLQAMRYCQEAIHFLEELKFEPSFDFQKIDILKKNIPRIDVYEEINSEISLRDVADVNPRDLLPSDSQMDWELGKLNEKFKKVMGK